MITCNNLCLLTKAKCVDDGLNKILQLNVHLGTINMCPSGALVTWNIIQELTCEIILLAMSWNCLESLFFMFSSNSSFGNFTFNIM